jgi:acyl-CoA thioesterase-1
MKALVHRLTFAVLALAGFVAASAMPAAAQTGAPLKIVAFGDSLTAGYGLPAQEAFPARLERALKAKGHDVEIENAGVSGDTASGGLSRLDWSIPDGTDAVIVELGANDMLRGVQPKVTLQALDDILAKLKARNIPVLLSGMRGAPNMGAEFVREFEAIFPALAQKYDVVFYPFFLDGVAADPRLALRDGVHPNGAGVQIIVDGILPKVEELIGRMKSKRAD